MNHVLESFLSLLSVSYLFAVLMLVGEKLASKVSHNHTHTNSQHTGSTHILQGQLSNRQVILWHVALLVGLLALPVAVIFILQLGPCESLSPFLSSCFLYCGCCWSTSDD